MHSYITIKNVSWPHFSWATLYIKNIHKLNLFSKLSALYVKITRSQITIDQRY